MSERSWFQRGLQGRHVLIGLVAFFGVMLVANGIFLYYALTTFGGGDTSDPYRKGLHYNDTIAEAARQDEQGWSAQLTYGADGGALALTLSDREGRPVSGLHFSATASRPATDKSDIAARFSEAGTGTYQAELRLAPGQWVVQLRSDELSRDGGPAYRLKQRLFVAQSP